VKGLFLPDGMDPEEFVNKEGPKALIDRIAKAPDLFTLLLEEEMKHSGATPSDKTKLIEKMAPILEVVENASLQGLYIESMAYMLNVDKSVIPVQKRGPSLQKRDSAVPRHKSLPTSVGEEGHANSRPDQIISVGKAPRAEVELLNVSLLKSVYLEEVLKSSAIAQMESEGIKMIFKELERLYRQSPERFDSLPSLLSSKVEPAEIVTLHLTGPFQSLTDEAARKLIHDCIKRLREKFLRSQSRVLLNNIKGSQGLDQREKLEQLMNIQRDTKDYRQDQKQEIKNENKTEPNPSIQEPNANE
jgi:DNA primase